MGKGGKQWRLWREIDWVGLIQWRVDVLNYSVAGYPYEDCFRGDVELILILLSPILFSMNDKCLYRLKGHVPFLPFSRRFTPYLQGN